jgi:orotidine-5'-phosphate decarboxylase
VPLWRISGLPQHGLIEQIAIGIHRRDNGKGVARCPPVGLVVGATAPTELHEIRAVAPGLGFLVPGIGAQGGEIAPVLRDGPATAIPAAGGTGRGLLVNVSRGISDAALGAAGPGQSTDPGERLAAAARHGVSR